MTTTPDSPDLPPVIDEARAEHLLEARDSIVDIAHWMPEHAQVLRALEHADGLLFYHETVAAYCEERGNTRDQATHATFARSAKQLLLDQLDRLDKAVFPTA